MKKYLQPEIEVNEFQGDCIMSSNLEKGDAVWDNETPLLPLN